MSQILKKRAKLIYILMFAFSLFIFVSSTVYITSYNNTALRYVKEVLEDPNAVDYSNSYLESFIKQLNGIVKDGTEEAKFNFTYGSFEPNQTSLESQDEFGIVTIERYSNYKILYRVMFDFNQKLQVTNNSIFYLGMFSLAMLAVMLICANASRRKYYISNLVSGVVCPSATIVFAGLTLFQNISAMLFLNKYWDMLNWGNLGNQNLKYIEYELNGKTYSVNPAVKWFIEGDKSHFELNYNSLIIYSIILGLFIICNGLLIAYNVFRYLDTKKQLKLEGLGD